MAEISYIDNILSEIQLHLNVRGLVGVVMEYANSKPVQRVKNLLIKKHIISNKQNRHEYLMLE